MGVFRLTKESHNIKPVWLRHDGTQKLFYSNSKFILIMITLDNDITAGRWMISSKYTRGRPKGVSTTEYAEDLWPNKVKYWKVWTGDEWQYDPDLTVTGNFNINILFLNFNGISTEDAPPPEYPEILTVKDKTGDRANLTGNYWRPGDSLVWKYDGKYDEVSEEYLNYEECGVDFSACADEEDYQDNESHPEYELSFKGKCQLKLQTRFIPFILSLK